MELTRDNYYTPEADWAYMSCSQYQSFLECEAAVLAKLDGHWVGSENDAFLVGNYFHSYMESPEAHKEFCEEHFDSIYKTKETKARGFEIVGKYAPYAKADEMLQVCMKSPIVKQFYEIAGEVEMIMTGKILGVPWRIRMDKFFPDRNLIIDWKTSANIRELKYNPLTKERETFAEIYGYLMRAAVYAEIVKQNTGVEFDPMFIIVAVSKQDFPDLGIFSLNHRQRWDLELEQVKRHLPHIMRVKNREERPRRCGECEYCRSTNQVKRIIPYYELKPDFKTEDEYDDFPDTP